MEQRDRPVNVRSVQGAFAAAVPAALVAGSVYLAAWPALHAYNVAAAPLAVAGAATASTFMAFVSGLILRVRPVASYALSMGSLAAFLLVIDGPHPAGVAEALARGPNRLLTETLPLSGPTIALSSLVVLVWIAGAATGESMVRIAGRRVPWGLAIPVGLYVLTFAVASSAPTRDTAGGPLLLVIVAIAAVLRVRSDSTAVTNVDPEMHPSSRLRGPLVGIAAAAALAATLALTLPTLPSFRGTPAVLHRRPPTITLAITDPVDSMSQFRDGASIVNPKAELAVRLSAPSTGYLGLVDLDDYDGGQWRFSATFQPSGGRIPGGDQGSHGPIGTTVSQRVDVMGALPVPLLPVLDRPLRITGIGADADAVTGMLLPQSAGHHIYTVVSFSPGVTLSGVPPADGLDLSAGVPADLGIPAHTSGDLATTLRFLSTLIGPAGQTGATHPFASVGYLQSVLAALQTSERRIDTSSAGIPQTTETTVAPSAPEGTALSEVIDAVTVNRAATPEQFATFFAMIARYLGVPARLVTGFRVASTSEGHLVSAGSYQVTGRQAWAWVEVPVSGFGWVVVDPTPDGTTAAAVPPPEAASASGTTLPPRQANAVPAAGSETGHALAPRVQIPRHSGHHPSSWSEAFVIVAGALGLGLAAGPGQAAVRRARRRRDRRSTDPRALAIGAWLEFLDGLERAGLAPADGATASEIATEVGHHFGREHVAAAGAIAAAADRAVFSERDGLTYEEAVEVWASAADLSHLVLAGLDRRQRLRAAVLVGSSPVHPAGGTVVPGSVPRS